MISDREFKMLSHFCPGYSMYTNGAELLPGYKPDYVLNKDNDYVILESENTSSRKLFIGGLIKAAHFTQLERTGKLVFVMVPKENTTAKSITEQLRTYFNWVKDKTNLSEIYVIEANSYYCNGTLLELLSTEFKNIALKV